MAQDPGEVGAQRVGDDAEKTPEQLRAEIEETREELGDTVEALAAKTDVKARARERADELKSTALHKKDELLSKVKQATPGGDSGHAVSATSGERAGSPADGAGPGGATSVVERLKGLAEENPMQSAALGAFVGGLALGRLLGRRR
jgi:hypothetical protein